MNAVNKNTVTEQEAQITEALNIITQEVDASQVPESIRATVETEDAIETALENNIAAMIQKQKDIADKVMRVHSSLLATDSMVNGSFIEKCVGSALNSAAAAGNKTAILATIPLVNICQIKRKGFVKASLQNVTAACVAYGFVKSLEVFTSDIEEVLK